MAELGYHGRRQRSDGWYYHQRQQLRRAKQGRFAAPTLQEVFSRDNLYRCFQAMKHNGGPAAGEDEISYADLSPQEAGQLMGGLSERLLDGSWRPSPTRPVLIPKPGGGHRELHLPVIADRVVAKALYDALSPLMEKIFVGGSYGFRPGKSVLQLLADLAADAEMQGKWVVTEDDVRKAFDSVPIDVAIRAHERLMREPAIRKAYIQADRRADVESPSLFAIVAHMLRGPDGQRTVGIDQGNPYSPAVLNLVLHYNVDVLLARDKPLRYRFADNLVSLSRSVHGGRQSRSASKRAVEAVPLGTKAQGPPIDLGKGKETELLGLTLRQENGRVEIRVPQGARDSLRSKLTKAYETANPSATATDEVRGWISAYGPAFESVENEVHWLLTVAAELGHRELPSRQELLRQANAARRQWTRVRHRGK